MEIPDIKPEDQGQAETSQKLFQIIPMEKYKSILPQLQSWRSPRCCEPIQLGEKCWRCYDCS